MKRGSDLEHVDGTCPDCRGTGWLAEDEKCCLHWADECEQGPDECTEVW